MPVNNTSLPSAHHPSYVMYSIVNFITHCVVELCHAEDVDILMCYCVCACVTIQVFEEFIVNAS